MIRNLLKLPLVLIALISLGFVTNSTRMQASVPIPREILCFLRKDLRKNVFIQKSNWEEGNHLLVQIGYDIKSRLVVVKSVKYFYYNEEYGLNNIKVHEKSVNYDFDSLVFIREMIRELPAQERVNSAVYESKENGEKLFPITGEDYIFATKSNLKNMIRYLKPCIHYNFFREEYEVSVQEYREIIDLIQGIGEKFELNELEQFCEK